MDALALQYSELVELTGGFIHDIKNHLSTLGLNLQLLAEDFAEPQNHRERRAFERVQRLQDECNRLVDISNDFLRFANVKDLDLHVVRLDEVVGEMIDFFEPTAREAGIELRWYSIGCHSSVRLDPPLFKQALLNLMLNAEQAMPNGGTLTLQAREENGWITLDVIDTGVGMPPDVLAKAFKPFHTTKPNGNGLGLPTARRIIIAHGGSIDVQSEVGRGTRFLIRLPIAQSAVA